LRRVSIVTARKQHRDTFGRSLQELESVNGKPRGGNISLTDVRPTVGDYVRQSPIDNLVERLLGNAFIHYIHLIARATDVKNGSVWRHGVNRGNIQRLFPQPTLGPARVTGGNVIHARL
jgi:hypothetical protein